MGSMKPFSSFALHRTPLPLTTQRSSQSRPGLSHNQLLITGTLVTFIGYLALCESLAFPLMLGARATDMYP